MMEKEGQLGDFSAPLSQQALTPGSGSPVFIDKNQMIVILLKTMHKCAKFVEFNLKIFGSLQKNCVVNVLKALLLWTSSSWGLLHLFDIFLLQKVIKHPPPFLLTVCSSISALNYTSQLVSWYNYLDVLKNNCC